MSHFPGWHTPGIGQCFVTSIRIELSPSGQTWVGPESAPPLLRHPHPSTELDSTAVPRPLGPTLQTLGRLYPLTCGLSWQGLHMA